MSRRNGVGCLESNKQRHHSHTNLLIAYRPPPHLRGCGDIRSVASEGNSHPITPINERRNVSKKCQKIADFLRAFRTDLHIILYTSLQSTSHQYSSVQPHCVSQCPASFKFVPHPTAEEQQCVPFRMTRRNGRIIVLVKMLTHSRALCVSE